VIGHTDPMVNVANVIIYAYIGVRCTEDNILYIISWP